MNGKPSHGADSRLIPSHGGYRNLKSFQSARDSLRRNYPNFDSLSANSWNKVALPSDCIGCERIIGIDRKREDRLPEQIGPDRPIGPIPTRLDLNRLLHN